MSTASLSREAGAKRSKVLKVTRVDGACVRTRREESHVARGRVLPPGRIRTPRSTFLTHRAFLPDASESERRPVWILSPSWLRMICHQRPLNPENCPFKGLSPVYTPTWCNSAFIGHTPRRYAFQPPPPPHAGRDLQVVMETGCV